MGNNCSCNGEISLGPWGYHTGKYWSFRPKLGGGIKQIIIRYSGVIDSVMFKGSAEGDDDSNKFGGEGGDKTAKIDIDFPSEFLTGVSGTHGFYFWKFGNSITSLTFQTNRNKYGPFGSGSGTAFSVNANDGVITEFHGRYGQYLEAIGVKIMPACSLTTEVEGNHSNSKRTASRSVPRGAGPRGGAGGREWDDGVFSAVYGVRVRLRTDTGVVSAVQFFYRKSDGSEVLSPFHGGSCGGDVRSKTVMIYKGAFTLMEKFSFSFPSKLLLAEKASIDWGGRVLWSGEGLNDVITSLTFITNKARYGPVGEEIGTFFAFMNSGDDCKGKVVGFHGRSGAYLDAIGVHAEYL